MPTPEERARWKSVVDEKILAAKTGDRASALWVMAQYVAALQNGALPIREIIQFFGEAFRDILEYQEEGRCTPAVIAASLCLERPAKRPSMRPKDARNRDLLFAALVFESLGKAGTETAAIDTVASKVNEWPGSHWAGRKRIGATNRARLIAAAWRNQRVAVESLGPEALGKILAWEFLKRPPKEEWFTTPEFEQDLKDLMEGKTGDWFTGD